MIKQDSSHLSLVRGDTSSSSAAVDALANAVTAEIRLLEDLVGIMRRQRQSVVTDDLQGIDDSVFATHRVLVTLGEARRQRRSLGRVLAGTDDVALRSLEEVLGDRMTPTLRDARDGLRAVALILSREVEQNRHVLREALSTGSEYVRALYGADQMEPAYSAEPQRVGSHLAGGLFLNRQV